MLEKLRELGIRDELIREITEYRETYPVEQEYGSRIPKLEQFYYGKEVWEQAITAILCGENILLAGPKARVCLQRIWREYLQDHGGMCRFM